MANLIQPEPTLEQVQSHVHKCPIGWIDGKIVTFRGTSEADIIAWVIELRKLVRLA